MSRRKPLLVVFKEPSQELECILFFPARASGGGVARSRPVPSDSLSGGCCHLGAVSLGRGAEAVVAIDCARAARRPRRDRTEHSLILAASNAGGFLCSARCIHSGSISSSSGVFGGVPSRFDHELSRGGRLSNFC